MNLKEILSANKYESHFENCKGCENHCMVKVFRFANGNSYYSGNNCEKVYSNKSESSVRGVNMFAEKYRMLFGRQPKAHFDKEPSITIGIPRGLGIYEDYPFWHTLFTECNIDVKLSSPSSNKLYEKGVHTIMADNICFPAKLMHGHIFDLIEKKVDRIFYPYVVYERKEDEKSKNSFNCPVVSGYSDVLRSSIDTIGRYNIPLDSPVITFNDEKLMYWSLASRITRLFPPNGARTPALQHQKPARYSL